MIHMSLAEENHKATVIVKGPLKTESYQVYRRRAQRFEGCTSDFHNWLVGGMCTHPWPLGIACTHWESVGLDNELNKV